MPTPSNENFKRATLLAYDYDGTGAQSFEESPNGYGVDRACEVAILSLFKHQGLESYRAKGGLRNRAPSEIVMELTPDANTEELAGLTQAFTDKKLDILLNEIGAKFPDGSVWPRPVPGYLETRELINEARADGRIIDEAVISSGHAAFMEASYEAWREPTPDIIVAQESVARIARSLGIAPPVKPSRVLMDMTHDLWRTSHGVHVPSNEDERTVYVGDDEIKDGGLAKNSGTSFVLIDAAQPHASWQRVARKLRLAREQG